MRTVRCVAAILAGTLAVGALAGCTGEDVFDALGSQVDPYAQKVDPVQADPSPAVANSAGTAQEPPAQATSADPAESITVTPPAAGADPVAADPAAQEGSGEKPPERSRQDHSQDEAVDIDVGGGTTIFANWTLDADGEWTAVFGTYNGTILYSYEDVEGNWKFYTLDGEEVVHTVVSSAEYGEYGPDGYASNWQGVSDGDWY